MFLKKDKRFKDIIGPFGKMDQGKKEESKREGVEKSDFSLNGGGSTR